MSGFDVLGPEGLPPARLLGQGPQRELARPEQADGGFGSALADAVREVERLGTEADAKAEALARGEPVELHELMVAMGKSEVAFNLMLEVRNKMVEAWQTLSRSVV